MRCPRARCCSRLWLGGGSKGSRKSAAPDSAISEADNGRCPYIAFQCQNLRSCAYASPDCTLDAWWHTRGGGRHMGHTHHTGFGTGLPERAYTWGLGVCCSPRIQSIVPHSAGSVQCRMQELWPGFMHSLRRSVEVHGRLHTAWQRSLGRIRGGKGGCADGVVGALRLSAFSFTHNNMCHRYGFTQEGTVHSLAPYTTKKHQEAMHPMRLTIVLAKGRWPLPSVV